MLDLYGASLDENQIEMEPVFLMEIMEINEALDETNSVETIDRIGSENKIILDGLVTHLSEAFKGKKITVAKETLARLKYYANIDEKVRKLQNHHAGIA